MHIYSNEHVDLYITLKCGLKISLIFMHFSLNIVNFYSNFCVLSV